MSKGIRIALWTAGGLLVVGVLVFVLALAALDFDFRKLNTQKTEQKTYEVAEAFSHLAIDTETAEITLVPSDNDKCRVECTEQPRLTYEVTVQDDTLTVRLSDTRQWFDHLRILFERPRLTVYLPQERYTSLTIATHTGDVHLPDRFGFDSVTVKGSTADVVCEAAVSDRLDLTTSTGDLTLIGMTCQSLSAQCSTGNIYLDNVTVRGDLRLQASTGNVHLQNSDASTLSVKTSTGDVTGTLRTPKTFLTHTSTGKVRVPTATSGGRCEITTSTGDIDIALS